jgi:hypothetical protein
VTPTCRARVRPTFLRLLAAELGWMSALSVLRFALRGALALAFSPALLLPLPPASSSLEPPSPTQPGSLSSSDFGSISTAWPSARSCSSSAAAFSSSHEPAGSGVPEASRWLNLRRRISRMSV